MSNKTTPLPPQGNAPHHAADIPLCSTVARDADALEIQRQEAALGQPPQHTYSLRPEEFFDVPRLADHSVVTDARFGDTPIRSAALSISLDASDPRQWEPLGTVTTRDFFDGWRVVYTEAAAEARRTFDALRAKYPSLSDQQIKEAMDYGRRTL